MRSGFIFEVLRLSYMTTYSLDTSGVQADIGLSMGIQGTEVAKESSDIIILDDNFASVVKVLVVNLDSKVKSREVVCWGRSVYANIQKFIQFQLTVNVAALITNVIAAVSSGNVPLNAVQVGYFSVLIIEFLGKFTSTVRLSWKLWLVSIAIAFASVYVSRQMFMEDMLPDDFWAHFLSWPLALVGKLLPVPTTPPPGEYVGRCFRQRGREGKHTLCVDRTIRWLTCDRRFGLADDAGSGARPPVNGSSV
ncbi:hypothetical protein B296_00057585 [Ensete ventricosum]|uniref:Cation-transporting P-type ATPase C-terminal domain-containing protein n=1 Tax=Ensete ventricosum TaxID=4639 RepID=A0A426X7M2_ENSVE|nr:hypothetical protein B296_00057585 [Ensete ventricosum]